MQIKSNFKKVVYSSLNDRAKENFNFHLIAAKLAEYGFASIRLTDDYGGADFLSIHVDGSSILRVQLKGRLSFGQKYFGKNIHIAFREDDKIYVYPHDELRDEIQQAEKAHSPQHSAWWDHGSRSWTKIPKYQQHFLDKYEI